MSVRAVEAFNFSKGCRDVMMSVRAIGWVVLVRAVGKDDGSWGCRELDFSKGFRKGIMFRILGWG